MPADESASERLSPRESRGSHPAPVPDNRHCAEMIPVVAAEWLSHAVARAECDLGREAVTERLLHAVEVLLERRSERQCRLDPVDASSNEPVRCKRLRTLNVPAGRSPCPETR